MSKHRTEMSGVSPPDRPRFVIKSSEPPPALNLTDAQREGLKGLEREQSIAPLAKALTVAAFLRMKPASDFMARLPADPRGTVATRARIEAFLTALGLLHLSKEMVLPEGRYQCYFFGKNEKALEVLLRLDTRDPGYHRETGAAVGIPRTAIDAWERRGNENSLLSRDEHVEKFGPELSKFFFFSPSRTHWEEERAWLQLAVNRIREISPEVYRQVIAESL